MQKDLIKRLINCFKLQIIQSQLIQSEYTVDGFTEALAESVKFFEDGTVPGKHLDFLNNFLEAHVPIPKDDILCKLWNKVGLISKLGQVTTLMYICDFMNRSVIPKAIATFKKEKKSYIFSLDPACGSGIFAVSAYNLFKKWTHWDKIVFHQVDIDIKACHMAILNLLIRNFNAVVWNADILISAGIHKDLEKPLQGWILKSGRGVSSLYKMTEQESYDNFIRAFGWQEKQGKKQDVKTGATGSKSVNPAGGGQMSMFA